MDQLEHKTLVTKPYDLTYSYYLSPNFHKNLSDKVPVLVISHGYPDDAYMWAHAVPTFLKLPYPFVLMDILGLGDSTKSTTTKHYNYKQQADSYAQILDKEGVGNNVIPIGHDWGSAISQRFYLHHRNRCVGLTLVSLAFQIPSTTPFDLDTANKETAKRFGYPQWEYWNFFTAPDAPKLMAADLSRMYEVNHGIYPSPKPEEKGRDIWMREMFCTPGQMRDYVAKQGKYKDWSVELRPYAKDPALKKQFFDRLSRDGWEGPVQYYHTLKNNTNLEDERVLVEDKDRSKIKHPLLFIGQTGDWVCRTDLMIDAKEAGLVESSVEEKVIDAGHWMLHDPEKAAELAGMVKDWLEKNYPVKS